MAEPWGNELASAAARGDLEQLTSLLQNNVNVNARNGFGRTALQVGIQSWGWEQVKNVAYVTWDSRMTAFKPSGVQNFTVFKPRWLPYFVSLSGSNSLPNDVL